MSNEQFNVNDYEQNIIKLKNINTNEMSDDVSVMFDYFRLNKEKLITDYTRLLIFKFDIPFRKM